MSRESGICDNRRSLYLDAIERAALSGLAEKLRDRQAIDLYVKTYNAERKRLSAEAASSRGKIEARLAQAARAYDRAYQGYVRGFISEDEAAVSIPALRAERDGVQAELDACEQAPAVLQLHPATVKSYLAAIDRLEATMAQSEVDGDAGSRQALRDLVESVVVFRPEADRGVTIEVHGQLSALVGEEAFPSETVRGKLAVAGEGLEPPTRGL